MTVERRFLTQEFRVSEQGEAPKIAGYAAVFDTPSEDMGWIEEIDPHAFDTVMAGQHDVRALWNHNDDVVLGRESAGTLRLNVDARGLAYEIDPPDTTAAKDLIVSMRRKDIRESSFGFITARDQWTDNPDGSVTRRILEFQMILDVSPVAFPAFTATSAGVRSLPDSMPVEMRSRFEKRALTDKCTCTCAKCMSGKCGICSADSQCEGAERVADDDSVETESSKRSADTWHEDAVLRLRLAEAELF
jgi:HK97 family phage prohead protease